MTVNEITFDEDSKDMEDLPEDLWAVTIPVPAPKFVHTWDFQSPGLWKCSSCGMTVECHDFDDLQDTTCGSHAILNVMEE